MLTVGIIGPDLELWQGIRKVKLYKTHIIMKQTYLEFLQYENDTTYMRDLNASCSVSQMIYQGFLVFIYVTLFLFSYSQFKKLKLIRL